MELTALKYKNLIVSFALCLLATTPAFAAQLTGTVTNGTMNKPSSGDEVAILSLSSGMDEIAHTRTDNQGHFTLSIADDNAQHLLRVTRQSVGYFKAVPPGATSADITVYDAATQLDNITTTARVFHFQASSGNLDVNDMYVLSNQSQPPRSRIGNQTFSIALPSGAEFDHASITGSSGMPLPVSSVPSDSKNSYAFDFPIRPGETRFEIFYKLPFNGKYEFAFTPESPLSELGVLLPKNMTFAGMSPTFRQDSDEGDQSVFFAKDVFANQPVKFSVSDTKWSDPIHLVQASASWFIGGAIVVVIVIAALVVWPKNRRAKSAMGELKLRQPSATSKRQAQKEPPEAEQGDMLTILKDELFQLESDRLSGKISAEEYEKTKAGLDTLMRRQMKR